MRALAQQLRAAETPTKALTRQFNQARRVAALMKHAHEQQAAQLHALRTRLNAAGIATADLGAHERRLRAELDRRRRMQAMSAAQTRARSMHGAGMNGSRAPRACREPNPRSIRRSDPVLTNKFSSLTPVLERSPWAWPPSLARTGPATGARAAARQARSSQSGP